MTTLWWIQRDAWRDLTPALEQTGNEGATFITAHGTLRWISATRREHLRQSLEGGPNPWSTDGIARPIRGDVHATPCGIFVREGLRQWEASTPIWLMLEGYRPDWPDTPEGHHVLTAITRHAWPPTPAMGHGPAPCGMAHCLRGPAKAERGR